jgi:hypothetical protein
MATTATIATAITKTVDAELALTKDGNSLDFLSEFETEDGGSDTSYRWNVNYTGNASTETYSEGDAYGAFGNELTAEASLSYNDGYRRTLWSMSGHAKDAIKSDNYYDAIAFEAQQSAAEHLKAQDAALIASAEAAVDSSGSYGGLLRSAYNMVSYEAAAGGLLALSDMRTAYVTLSANPIEADFAGGKYVIIGDAGVIGEYGDVAVGTTSRPVTTVSADTAIDAGTMRYVNYYEGIPMKQVRGVTSGTMLWLPKTMSKIIERRAPKTESVYLNQDAEGWAISSSYIFVAKDPRRCAKITD